MNEWITSVKPPGLMKLRLMHHQEQSSRAPSTSQQSMMWCVTPTMSRCHMNSCMVISTGLNNAGSCHMLVMKL